MPKNIEDIVVPERRKTIRDIPIPEGRRRVYQDEQSMPKEFHYSASSENGSGNYNKFSRNSKKGKWFAIGVSVLLLLFAIISFFDSGTLAYTPRSEAVSFTNDVYTAEKGGKNFLDYSVIKLSKDKSVEVAATGEEDVERKASGTIVVYNNATAESQRFVENTRFETKEGLVYRISAPIVIPGRKKVGNEFVPGSLETVVYADVAGEKYNISLSDFTVPGLKGNAKYTAIYARSKTPMTGGFVGTEKIVDEDTKAKMDNELETALRDELLAEARAQLPEDFILMPSLSYITFEDLPQKSSADNPSVAILNKKANMTSVMFKATDLFNHLATGKLNDETEGDIYIQDIEKLTLGFVDFQENNLGTANKFKFSVSGDVLAVWQTDELSLKMDLAGKNKGDIPMILKNYPTIVSATATVRPFWKTDFPRDTSRITLKKLSPQ